MTDHDIDRRLCELLARPTPTQDSGFVDRVVLAAKFDRQVQASRRQGLIRTLGDCGAATAVAASFYLLSQMGGAPLDGMIVPGDPAMAGLIMLLLWSVVALPHSRGSGLDLVR